MSATQEDIRELLPFWVNGTLTDAERAEVARAIEGAPELREELTALEALRSEMKAAPMPNAPGELGLARLLRAIEAETARPAPARWPGMGRLAASVAVAAVLASAATYSVIRNGDAGDEVYVQASGEDAAALLTVTFQPTATEAAISALLKDKGLVIVDGPSAVGLYRIGLPYDMTTEDAASYLAAATEVIATVEKVE